MHTILTKSKAWQGFETARDKANAEYAEQREAAEAALLAYNEGCAVAAAAGTPMPPQPAVSIEHLGKVLTIQLNQIDEKRREWVRANLTDLFTAAWEREDKIIARVAEMWAELAEFDTEVGEMLATLRRLHQLAGNVDTVPSTGTSVGLLLEAGRTDTRLLREPFATDPRRAGQTFQ